LPSTPPPLFPFPLPPSPPPLQPRRSRPLTRPTCSCTPAPPRARATTAAPRSPRCSSGSGCWSQTRATRGRSCRAAARVGARPACAVLCVRRCALAALAALSTPCFRCGHPLCLRHARSRSCGHVCRPQAQPARGAAAHRGRRRRGGVGGHVARERRAGGGPRVWGPAAEAVCHTHARHPGGGADVARCGAAAMPSCRRTVVHAASRNAAGRFWRPATQKRLGMAAQRPKQLLVRRPRPPTPRAAQTTAWCWPRTACGTSSPTRRRCPWSTACRTRSGRCGGWSRRPTTAAALTTYQPWWGAGLARGRAVSCGIRSCSARARVLRVSPGTRAQARDLNALPPPPLGRPSPTHRSSSSGFDAPGVVVGSPPSLPAGLPAGSPPASPCAALKPCMRRGVFSLPTCQRAPSLAHGRPLDGDPSPQIAVTGLACKRFTRAPLWAGCGGMQFADIGTGRNRRAKGNHAQNKNGERREGGGCARNREPRGRVHSSSSPPPPPRGAASR
jgi:hypothetical protein